MKTVTKQDIFDENGVLLIKKGVNISQNSVCFEILDRLGAFQEKKTANKKIHLTIQDKNNKQIKDFIQKYMSKDSGFTIDDVSHITNLINTIIHENKTKPWYLHLNTLFNYVDWLYAHSINVALISGMMGLKLNLSEAQIFNLTIGALLHDIGLILIPKQILLKADTFSKEENDILQKHAELGYSMLQEADLSKETQLIVLQHHERIDGTGYPNSLNSTRISLFSQIVSIADSFDSATSYRPYKAVKTINEVLDDLNNSSSYNNHLVHILSTNLA